MHTHFFLHAERILVFVTLIGCALWWFAEGTTGVIYRQRTVIFGYGVTASLLICVVWEVWLIFYFSRPVVGDYYAAVATTGSVSSIVILVCQGVRARRTQYYTKAYRTRAIAAADKDDQNGE